MKFDADKGVVIFEQSIILSPTVTKKELFHSNKLDWEGWPEKKDNKTLSYRTILKSDKKFGDIYLIIDFLRPNDPDSALSGWRFAPEKLLMGEQKKIEGSVTRNLRAWFNDKTSISLPVSGQWGHIDASYDLHNRTGTIVCNYRQGFNSNEEWEKYREWNDIP